MRRLGTIVGGLTLAGSLVFAGGADARPATTGGAVTVGRYIVVHDNGITDADAASARRERSQGFHARLRYSRAVKGFAATLTAKQANRLRADPAVASVTEDRVVTTAATAPLAAGEPLPPSGVRRSAPPGPAEPSPGRLSRRRCRDERQIAPRPTSVGAPTRNSDPGRARAPAPRRAWMHV